MGEIPPAEPGDIYSELRSSAEIYVVNDDGADGAPVFEVGRGQDRSLLAEELGGLHVLDVATENDAVVRTDDEFTVADIEAAVPADDELGLALALGDVAKSVNGDLLCHFHAEGGRILRFFLFENIEQ